MSKTALSPDEARLWVRRRFTNQHRSWLEGEGSWPLSVPLGGVTEGDFARDPDRTRQWVQSWQSWDGAGEVVWETRQWSRLGAQRVPIALRLASADEAALVARESRAWRTAAERIALVLREWPQVASSPGLARHYEAWANWDDEDFARLLGVLRWLEAHPTSGVFIRQLPIEGIDTKWLERRTGLVLDCLSRIQQREAPAGLYEACGLRRAPPRIRLRVLCPRLRARVAGLTDLEAPVHELASLALTPRRFVIVENLESGLSLPTLDDTVAFLKLGYSVDLLAQIPWAQQAHGVYWGDIDTHGLAILALARRTLPGIRSVLMDEATLLSHRKFWTMEPSQHGALTLQGLDEAERVLFENLRLDRWGASVRLEQERLRWDPSLRSLLGALETPPPTAQASHSTGSNTNERTA